LAAVSDRLRKRRLVSQNSGFTSLKMLVFLSALAAVIAGGGYLLYYVSKNPMIESPPPSAPAPKPAPGPAPEPVQPTESDAGREKVLKIDPKNSSALKLFPKAESIERVMALVASGNQHAQNGALFEAKKDYQEALSLDPASGPAKTALNQINRRIADKQFRQHMSSGMAALDSGKYYAAQDAFIKAKNIRPDASEVKDALNQVDAAIRLKLIEDLKKEAAAAERAEDWSGALEGYTAVLKIDESLRFALEGKSRSLERSLIDKRLQYYLEKPDVLASDPYLGKAVDLVGKADAAEPKGPRIRNQIETLGALIRIAETPIKVLIASDNSTEVAIYKVGKFGRFQKKELHLRPGTYTVVGVREGYKDVRQKMVVRADGPPLQVVIRCEERI
jgi:eukaryotic-like serine/threonine-protein kinase